MTTDFAPLSDSASRELTCQIETMHGDMGSLIAAGFGPGLAACLVSAITAGVADMNALRGEGVEMALAITICEAVAARRARLDAAVARIAAMPKSPIAPGAQPPPLPLPAHGGISFPPRPLGRPLTTEPTAAATDEPIGRITALNVLHTLCEAIDAGRCEASTLHWGGLSAATSQELAHLINSTGGTGD